MKTDWSDMCVAMVTGDFYIFYVCRTVSKDELPPALFMNVLLSKRNISEALKITIFYAGNKDFFNLCHILQNFGSIINHPFSLSVYFEE